MIRNLIIAADKKMASLRNSAQICCHWMLSVCDIWLGLSECAIETVNTIVIGWFIKFNRSNRINVEDRKVIIGKLHLHRMTHVTLANRALQVLVDNLSWTTPGNYWDTSSLSHEPIL